MMMMTMMRPTHKGIKPTEKRRQAVPTATVMTGYRLQTLYTGVEDVSVRRRICSPVIQSIGALEVFT